MWLNSHTSGVSGHIYQLFLKFVFSNTQKVKHENELNSLSKGDRVLSRGGIIGKIIEFQGKDNDIVVLDTEHNGKLTIQKSFILKKIVNS